MAAATHTDSFESALGLVSIGSASYSAELSANWTIGDAPHGGYLAALFHRVATTHFADTRATRHGQQASLMGMHLTFVRRSTIGSAQFEVEVVKVGARTSILRITMCQSQSRAASLAAVKIVGCITMSNSTDERGLSVATRWDQERPRCQPPPYDINGWARMRIPYPEFRRATSHVEVYKAIIPSDSSDGQHTAINQWARLRWSAGRELVSGRWTKEAATFLLDIFPQALRSLEEKINASAGSPTPIWFPTLTLNIDFQKKLADDGVQWLYSEVRVKSVRNGRLNIEVVLRDESWDIVAIATHVALAMGPPESKM